jgi:hypothetical protein
MLSIQVNVKMTVFLKTAPRSQYKFTDVSEVLAASTSGQWVMEEANTHETSVTF